MQRMEDLIEQTVPSDIRLGRELALDDPRSEAEALEYLEPVSAPEPRQQKLYWPGLLQHPHARSDSAQRAGKSRLVYRLHALPARNFQGRLEGLLNFQQVIMDLNWHGACQRFPAG